VELTYAFSSSERQLLHELVDLAIATNAQVIRDITSDKSVETIPDLLEAAADQAEVGEKLQRIKEELETVTIGELVGTPPAMFEHACKVYAAMDAEASEERPIIDGQVSDTADVIRVYEGHLTTLFQNLEVSAPYYTTIMRAIKGMGCAEQLRRGGGTATSRWQLNYPPTLEGYMAYHNNKPSRKQGVSAAFEQRLSDLVRRVENIEKYLREK
jgi:hypothetical protein